MDRVTKEQRSKNMREIKNKDSKIEVKLRKALWLAGIRYRKNYKDLEGKPDIVITKYKICIFCDSEFWHGKDWSINKFGIKTRREFWWRKIEGNMLRDRQVNELLALQGWQVIRFWGRDIEQNIEQCLEILTNAMKSRGDV